MDSFNLKVEKANAIMRYRRLQNITTLFRFMEFCVFLIMISRFTTQFPFSFKISGDYFKELSVAILSPRYVFIVGNAIILILFLKSGKISAQESMNNDFYDKYIENCEKSPSIIHAVESKKQSTCEETESRDMMSNTQSISEKKMYRSHSENYLKGENDEYEDSRRRLRRTVTDTYQKSVNYGEKVDVNSYAEDNMSGEEFRRKVEDFIARQQRSLREQEFSAIVSFDP